VYDSRDSAREIGIAGCSLHPQFVEWNAHLLRSEFTEGRTTARAVAAVGQQCATMTLRQGDWHPDGVPFDLAVLQLERPVPHEIPNPLERGAGSVAETPIELATSFPSGTIEGILVGYGFTGGTGGGSGIRRYRTVEARMGSREIRLPFRATDSGDSGGPMLLPTGNRYSVAGVISATSGSGSSSQSHVASLDRAQVRSWIKRQTDRDGNGEADIFCGARDLDSASEATPATDRDGDGHLDGKDTCPGTYNPCQAQSDVDGDGVHDDCDACPNDPSVTRPRGDPGLNDMDGDGLPDECDCEKGDWTPWLDPDRDFIRTACDNCDREANTSQANLDADDDGDACDACPAIANVGWDDDADALPNECDNCPSIANPLQANCNVEAEAIFVESDGLPRYAPSQGKVGLGDACDPTPCGDARLGTTETASGNVRRVARDLIKVDAIRGDGASEVARVGPRFCRCNAAFRDTLETKADTCTDTVFWDDDPTLFTGECVIADISAYDFRDTQNAWRPMEVDYTLPGVSTPPLIGSDPLFREAVSTFAPREHEGVFREDYRGQWRVENDLSRWASKFSSDPPVVAGPRGVLWTHTPGPDQQGTFFSQDKRRLANHYLAGHVEIQEIELRPPQPCRLPLVPWLPRLPEPICPLCGGAFPGAWLTLPHDVLSSTLCGGPLPFPPVFRLPDSEIDAGPAFTTKAEPVLRSEAGPRWLAAGEPESWLPEEGPMYVAVSDQGDQVLAALEMTADGLDEARVTGASASPPPRVGHFSALSAARGRLWVGGGLSEGGKGPATTDLWAFDFQRRQWSRVQVEGPVPIDAVAAVYSPVENMLWVLERIDDDRYHLVAVPPQGGEAQTVATFDGQSSNDRFELAADPSGALYVACAGEGGDHDILRLQWSSGVMKATGYQAGQGLLSGSVPVRASGEGLSVMVQSTATTAKPLGYRVDELQPVGKSSIAQCF
jgi:hypothetical protein